MFRVEIPYTFSLSKDAARSPWLRRTLCPCCSASSWSSAAGRRWWIPWSESPCQSQQRWWLQLQVIGSYESRSSKHGTKKLSPAQQLHQGVIHKVIRSINKCNKDLQVRLSNIDVVSVSCWNTRLILCDLFTRVPPGKWQEETGVVPVNGNVAQGTTLQGKIRLWQLFMKCMFVATL